MLWWRHVRAGAVKFSKSWLETLPFTAKNTPLFLFPYIGDSLQIFARGMLLHAHVFSFTHNAVVLSHFRCIHPKIRRKFFDFNIFMNQNKHHLTQDLKWSLNNIVHYKYSLSPASNWFVTLLYYCFLHWDHLPNMAVGDLAFHYTLYLWSTQCLW